MFFKIGPNSSGTSIATVCMGSLVLAMASTSSAETVATVNGATIDSAVVNLYLESRLQMPAAQATEEQRDLVLQELTDIYLLTTQPRAKELQDDEATRAQIELQTRGVMAQTVATDFLARNPASDAEIREVYEAQLALPAPDQYNARHILVESQGEAVALIVQLDEGADFAELAIANSTGPSGPAGGDLGWFDANQMVQPFSVAVASMEIGAYTKSPVQTEFGWHVIKLEDTRASEAPTFESVSEAIKQNIEQSRFQAYLEDLRTSYANPE